MSDVEATITKILSRYPQIRLAILFGSQADGSAGPQSDIDLGLLADAPLGPSLTLELIEQLAMACGRPVDIVDMFYGPEPIMGQIFKGRKLLGDHATYADQLSRHLLNEADFMPLYERIIRERRAEWIK